MTGARLGRAAVAVLLVLGVGACGDDDAQPASTTADSTDGTTGTVDNDGSLPPAGALDLEPIYGDALAEIGLKLTDRGGLIDRSGGGYVQSAEGDHLALYVEPIDDRTTPQYIDGIRSVAAVFGDVFDRWSGLASYDVCQEPADDDQPEPLPVTQIELTRAEAAAFDWDSVTVVDLVRASLADPQGLALRVSAELSIDPAYEAIVAEAT